MYILIYFSDLFFSLDLIIEGFTIWMFIFLLFTSTVSCYVLMYLVICYFLYIFIDMLHFVYLFVYLFICLFIYLFIYLFTYLFIYFSLFSLVFTFDNTCSSQKKLLLALRSNHRCNNSRTQISAVTGLFRVTSIRYTSFL